MRTPTAITALAVAFFAQGDFAAPQEQLSPDHKLEIMREQEKSELETVQRLFAAKQAVRDGALPVDHAVEVALATLNHCRSMGYVTSVTVTDSAGTVKAMLRDDGAWPGTLFRNEKKIRVVVASGVSSGKHVVALDERMRAKGHRISPKDVDQLPGALPLKVNGELVGVLAVSGAPTGTLDEFCAESAVTQDGRFDPL